MPAQYRMNDHCPGLKEVPGTANQLICYEFICICSTSVTAFWREKLEKLNYGTNSYIGINEKMCTSWQNHLKMWCIYWVMSFKHWKHISACEDYMHIRLLPDYSMLNWCDSFNGAIVIWYTYVQEKWEQMIYLWRGLTLKQILENERIGHPLTKTQLMMCQAATIMASFWFSRNFWSLVIIFFFLALFTLLVIWLFRL